MSEVFWGMPESPPQKKFIESEVTSTEPQGCEYCGWIIPAGEKHRLVERDEGDFRYCLDDEECSLQAGK